mmetsp:Transcript_6425/g.15536  ORF Transcript_6425/g.15536 Transcript_6425/m.15536 type:complete len:91 (+) Transcript_6425:105-377(+)
MLQQTHIRTDSTQQQTASAYAQLCNGWSAHKTDGQRGIGKTGGRDGATHTLTPPHTPMDLLYRRVCRCVHSGRTGRQADGPHTEREKERK